MAAVIGFVADVISLLTFGLSAFPDNGGPSATVRVVAALNGGSHNLGGADGTIAHVRLFNENQQLIGNIGSANVPTGQHHDFQIAQVNAQQATYAQVYASNDAICVPWISANFADGVNKYGWVGDWGAKCGLDWYYGNYFIDSSNVAPLCTWLDADHTNGFKTSMLMIHFPSFAGTPSTNVQDYCGFPALRAYQDGNSIFKRTSPPDSRLVVSSHDSHNATELCASETSRGPDFVSLAEGVYCNMETREILPLCQHDGDKNCFDTNGHKNVKRDGSVSGKKYSSVMKWDGKK